MAMQFADLRLQGTAPAELSRLAINLPIHLNRWCVSA
jgi:hypothetical protein